MSTNRSIQSSEKCETYWQKNPNKSLVFKCKLFELPELVHKLQDLHFPSYDDVGVFILTVIKQLAMYSRLNVWPLSSLSLFISNNIHVMKVYPHLLQTQVQPTQPFTFSLRAGIAILAAIRDLVLEFLFRHYDYIYICLNRTTINKIECSS